jgi:hypothetical protein
MSRFEDHIIDELHSEISKRLSEKDITIVNDRCGWRQNDRHFFVDFVNGVFAISETCGRIDLADPNLIEKAVANLEHCHGFYHTCKGCSLHCAQLNHEHMVVIGKMRVD